MALPELKNSNKMADLIKLTNEISLIGFQDMTNFLETQTNVLQDIKDVLYDQYESYLAAERERRENEKEARNKNQDSTETATDTKDTKDTEGGMGLPGFSGIIGLAVAAAGILAAVTLTKEDFEKLGNFFREELMPKLEEFYEKGLKPFYENVLVPIAEWFKDIALPALGDTFVRFVDDLTSFFGGLSNVGKLIKEGDYLGAVNELVNTIGEFIISSVDNVLTLAADLFGIDLGGKTVFESIDDWFTGIVTSIKDWWKDNVYDGSGDRTKIFGQELPTFDDIGNWATSIKEKIGNFIKDNIYDGENNKIFGFTIPEKLFEFNMFTSIKQSVDDVIESIEKIFSGDFSMENLLQGASGLLDLVQAPLNLAINAIKDIFKWGDASEPFRLSKFIADTISNITDMFAWDEEGGFDITGTLKNFANMIYNPETGEIFGINFSEIFDIIPSMDDIKKKLTGLIPDLLGGGGDDSVDLSASLVDPGADKVDLKKMKTELDAGNEKKVMKYLSDTKADDGIENEKEVMKILKSYGIDSIPQAAEGGITPKQPGLSKIGSLMNIHPQEAIIPLEKTGQFLMDALPFIAKSVEGVLSRNGEAVYRGSNEVNKSQNGTTIIAPQISDNSVKTNNTMSGGGGGKSSTNVRALDESVRDFITNPYM
jgi:hypothetical protein